MVNLEVCKSDRNASRSVMNGIWGALDDFDRSLFVPIFQRGTAERSMAPACDVTENEDGFLLSFDVPGIKKEEINIEVTGRQLSVSGERKREEGTQNGSIHRVERAYGKFHRTFDLPHGTNAEVVEASYDNGVLKIAIPKAEASKPRKIQVGELGKGILRRLTNKSEM